MKAFGSLSNIVKGAANAVGSVMTASEYSFEQIPDSEFPERYGCRVSLFQDAHVGPSLLPTAVAREEMEQDAFTAIYKAILEAEHFVLITGWSVDTDTALLRYPEQDPEGKGQMCSLGELLKRKAREGVKVQVHVWNELASVELGPAVKFAGMMGTSDEKTKKFFSGSPVEVLLSYRNGPTGHENMFFTHHQKTVIVDAPLISKFPSTNSQPAPKSDTPSAFRPSAGSDSNAAQQAAVASRVDARRRRLAARRREGGERRRRGRDQDTSEERRQRRERRRARAEENTRDLDLDNFDDEAHNDSGEDDEESTRDKRLARARRRKVRNKTKRRRDDGDSDDGNDSDDDDDDDKKKKKKKGRKGKKKGKKGRRRRRRDSDDEKDDDDDRKSDDDVEDDDDDESDDDDEVYGDAFDGIPEFRSANHGLDSSKKRVVAFVGGLDLTGGRWDDPSHHLYSSMANEHANDFYQGWQLDSKIGPRQPWHDIHSMVEGPVARDVLTNFVERWEKQGKTPAYKLDENLYLTIEEEETYVKRTMQGDTTACPWAVRLLRSIDEYSATNVKGHEAGIQKEYVRAIRNTKRFIYIENQYFMGSAQHWKGNDTTCHNLIPYEIATRICRSIDENSPVYAYIVLPLFPEGLPDSGALQEVLRWQWKTMTMMYRMIAEALARNGVNHHPQNYLNFYCPGNREEAKHSTAPDQNGDPIKHPLETKLLSTRRFMIYVHSKMMIVDDEVIIVGSANINERSMAGDRDTEIAIVASQTQNKGRTKLSNGAIHRFRLSLWAEHCGSYQPEYERPDSDACLVKVNTIADKNWAAFISPHTADMDSHLMHYPLTVTYDGQIEPAVDHFPESTGSIAGARNHVLPDKVTT